MHAQVGDAFGKACRLALVVEEIGEVTGKAGNDSACKMHAVKSVARHHSVYWPAGTHAQRKTWHH